MVRLEVIGLAILISAEQLGLAGPATSLGFSVLLRAIPVAAIRSFGLGGGELAENMLASQMLKAQLSCGDRIGAFEDIEGEGTAACIGWAHTRRYTRDGTLLIPGSHVTSRAGGPEIRSDSVRTT